jgi:hypothetical protein
MSWFETPKTFVEETKAKASEVNENFAAIRKALNELYEALFNSEGKATSPKLGLPGTKKIERGNNTVTSGDEVGYSDISHNLGATPTAVVAVESNGAFQVNCVTNNYTSTTFRLYAYRTDGLDLGTVTCAWIAMS